jgi:hypothetical protein
LFRAAGRSPVTAVVATGSLEICWNTDRRAPCPRVGLVRVERFLRLGLAGGVRARERVAGAGQPPASRVP